MNPLTGDEMDEQDEREDKASGESSNPFNHEKRSPRVEQSSFSGRNPN